MKYFWFLSFLPTLVFAQNNCTEVKGKVLSDGEGVAFANVFITETQTGTQTDENGNFELCLPSKNVSIVITALGYTTLQTQGELENNHELVFHLQAEITALDEVFLDKQSGLTRRTPYTVSSLSTQQAEQLAHPGGLAGALTEVPGLSGAAMGPGIVKPFVRGLGFSRVVTLYQGNKLENHQWGQDHGLGLNSLGVKSVDVVKGPASMLYGSGAIGGVLLVKDDEQYLNKDGVTAQAGTALNAVSNGVKGFASAGNRWKNDSFLAADAAYESHADYRDGDGRTIGNSRFNNRTLRLHTGLDKVRFKNKLSFTYHRQNLGIIEDNEMEESLATTPNDRSLQLPFQEISDYLASYRQETFHENFSTYLHLSHHLNDRNEIEDAPDAIDLGLRQHHSFYSGRISLHENKGYTHTFGFQGSFINTANKKESQEILIPDARTVDIGGYYLVGKSWERLFLQAGLRFDYRQVTATARSQHLIDYGFVLPGEPDDRSLQVDFAGASGSLGATYELAKRQKLKLNLSTGFRAPDLAELFSNGPHPGTNRFEMGNAGFDREQSVQTDLGYVYTWGKVSVATSAYYSLLSDYIFFANTGQTRPEDGLEIWAFQQEDARLYGGEAEVEYRPFSSGEIEIKTTAAWVRGELHKAKENLTFIPADNYRLQLKYAPDFVRNLRFSSQIQYTAAQERMGRNEQETPGYTLVNLQLEKDFVGKKNKLSVALLAQNLFNKTYVEHLSILRAFHIPNPGRNLGLVVRFWPG